MTRGELHARLSDLERDVDALPVVVDPEDQKLIAAGLKRMAAGETMTPAQVVAMERWPLGRNPEADAAIMSQLSLEELHALASRALLGEDGYGEATPSGDGAGREGR
jgi:hypothetical protein